MKKVPTIVLSVSYKGVKFIDATNKVACTTPATPTMNNTRKVTEHEWCVMSEQHWTVDVWLQLHKFKTVLWLKKKILYQKKKKIKCAIICMKAGCKNNNSQSLKKTVQPIFDL